MIAVGLTRGLFDMRVPAPRTNVVEIRFAPLTDRDRFDRLGWRREPLQRAPGRPGYWELDVDALLLPDGDYEYEFILDGRDDQPVADPYADELVRFGGYRGLFHIRGAQRWRPPFSWADELRPNVRLPNNNELVIYELPLRWVAGTAEEHERQIGLGTFDRVIFERLDELADLGVNAIELLPVQDSPDTLNWGYGNRFFLAPDLDMGAPVDLKVLVKRCHQHGIRVILDVVMNHAKQCPLEALADDWFFLLKGDEEPGRGEDWGGRLFRYRRPAADGQFPARTFHYDAADWWIREYHIDGFRIDEFRGIDHWEFIQTFKDRAAASFRQLFPGRPFLIIAEDSWRRAQITQDRPDNPNGRRVVDAIWNFAYRDEARRLFRDQVVTSWGQPARRDRIRAMVTGSRMWDAWDSRFKDGFDDLAQAVNYLTSHDVEKEGEQRLMNFLFGGLLRRRELGDGGVQQIRGMVNRLPDQDPSVQVAHTQALDQVRSGFGLLLTSVGIPMVLAGEEFADVHDLEHSDWRLKMSDPVDHSRRDQPGHRALWNAVRDLVRLRTTHPALQRNEVEFLYFHPQIDDNAGVRVFAYCRTANAPMGRQGQVVVIANCGPQNFPEFDVPWPWTDPGRITEHGVPLLGGAPVFRVQQTRATVSLDPFQVRVFAT